MVPYFKFGSFIGKKRNHLTLVDSLECEIDLINQKLEAIEKWHIDLEELRSYKRENELVHYNKNTSNIDLKTISLFTLVFLNIILMIKLFIKNK